MAAQIPGRIILSITIIFLLTGLLSACQTPTPPAPTATPTPSPWIDVILNDPDCAPPCWNGITPGMTMMDEAMSILQAEPDLKNLRFEEDPLRSGSSDVSYSWDFEIPDGWGIIRSNHYSLLPVRSITLGSQSSSMFTLEQVIEYWGEPYKLSGYQRGLCLFRCVYEITAYYPEKGVIFNLEPVETNWFRRVDIHPDTQVYYSITFQPPFTAELDGYDMKWEGYGTYKMGAGRVGD